MALEFIVELVVNFTQNYQKKPIPVYEIPLIENKCCSK